MAFAEKLIAVRRANNLTQEQLAARLYVTRQAVSRWERGEVTPGIDTMKLIAAVTGEPLSHLLEMPEHYCESCGMLLTPDDCGTDATGATTDHYCKWCYGHGKYTYETTMEAMIEDCAPRLAQNTGMSLDEAVSLMGAVLPQLERWRTVQENEKRYGAEARTRYGDEAVDAANEALLDMDPQTWNDMKELERAILGQLSIAMGDGEPEGSEARKLVAMHRRWIALVLGQRAPRRGISGARPRLPRRPALRRLLRQAMRHRGHGVSGPGDRVIVGSRLNCSSFGYLNQNPNRLETYGYSSRTRAVRYDRMPVLH